MANERFVNSCLNPTMKHGGGNIMIWGGICTKEVTLLKRIEGVMDKKYHPLPPCYTRRDNILNILIIINLFLIYVEDYVVGLALSNLASVLLKIREEAKKRTYCQTPLTKDKLLERQALKKSNRNTECKQHAISVVWS